MRTDFGMRRLLRKRGMVLVTEHRAKQMSVRAHQQWIDDQRRWDADVDQRNLANELREAQADAKVWKGIAEAAELKAAEARIALTERTAS